MRSQNVRSIYQNLLYIYILAMNNLRKQIYLPDQRDKKLRNKFSKINSSHILNTTNIAEKLNI